MKNKIIFLFLILLLISLLIPTILWLKDFFTSTSDKISSTKLNEYAVFQTFIISFWGLVLNGVLVYIAYKAFQNFDVKKQFHNKQLELVTQLSKEISDLKLSNMIYSIKRDPTGKNHKIAVGFTLTFWEISSFNYKNCETMFFKGSSIDQVLPFLKYRNDPLLPMSISKSLKSLYKWGNYVTQVENDIADINYVEIYRKKTFYQIDDPEFLFPYYADPQEFVKDSLELRNSIISWFKDYGADNLNI